jgi:hypothetical protein
MSQTLVEFRTVALHPAPHRCVIGFQTMFLEQLFHIAQRKRISKIPMDGTENQLRLRLPPFEHWRPSLTIAGLGSFENARKPSELIHTAMSQSTGTCLRLTERILNHSVKSLIDLN